MKEQAYTLREIKALMAICNDCDDIEGEGFTRPADALLLVLGIFRGDGDMAGKCVKALADKGAISFDFEDDTLWVDREVYATFC